MYIEYPIAESPLDLCQYFIPALLYLIKPCHSSDSLSRHRIAFDSLWLVNSSVKFSPGFCHTAELIMEALQLREFGWTQQQIADDLKVPLGTIDTWLRKYISNDVAKNVRNGSGITDMSSYPFTEIKSHPIRLFPCRYEEVFL